jgi:hypothetical protein
MEKVEVFRVDSKETKEMVFVAAWADAKEDWTNQLALLKKHTHPIAKLQAHFEKYGADDMVLTVVKKVSSFEDIVKEITKCKEQQPEKKVIPENIAEAAEEPKDNFDKMPDEYIKRNGIKPAQVFKAKRGRKK